jgi:hypothetical protein
MCAAREGHACPPPISNSECVVSCQDGLKTFAAGCESEYNEVLGCLEQEELQCSASGVLMPADEKACSTQMQAVFVCAACNPVASDPPCTACLKQKCCTEFRAGVDHPEYLDWAKCRSACNDDTLCEIGCDDMYPSFIQGYEPVEICGTANCAAECGV